MERLENEIVCVSVQLNNGFAVVNGYMSKDDLEEDINFFLSYQNQDDVIDIKYSGNGNHSNDRIDYYSAMIILKK